MICLSSLKMLICIIVMIGWSAPCADTELPPSSDPFHRVTSAPFRSWELRKSTDGQKSSDADDSVVFERISLGKAQFRLPAVWWKHVKTIRISAKYDNLIEFYINESIYHLFLHLFNYVVSLREAWVATHWQLQRPRGEFPPRRFTRRVRVPVTPQRRRFGRLV